MTFRSHHITTFIWHTWGIRKKWSGWKEIQSEFRYDKEIKHNAWITSTFIFLYCNVKISCNQENTTHGHLLKQLIKRQRETTYQHLMDNGHISKPFCSFQINIIYRSKYNSRWFLNSINCIWKQHIVAYWDPLQIYKYECKITTFLVKWKQWYVFAYIKLSPNL